MEITRLHETARRRVSILLTALWLMGLLTDGRGADLISGEYFVTQSWSQETQFERPYYVSVPRIADQETRPVLIFLHGNGGNARGAMRDFMNRYPSIAGRYITVFAEGYLKSWNIVSERSKADDLGFIEAIVQKVSSHSNVRKHRFSIMGVSNGAALVNQLAIESRLPDIRNYISSVSPLNVFQHDGENFKARGGDNNYQATVRPMTGKRLMNISGTEDDLVPYRGGLSSRIPAKDGRLGFVDAEESIYIWARHMGHTGEKLARPSRIEDNLEIFSYLGGDVIHYKVVGKGHGATRSIDEKTLLAFLENEGL